MSAESEKTSASPSPSAAASEHRWVLGTGVIVSNLAGMAVVAIALAAFFYTGFYGSDDVAYLDGIRLLVGDPGAELTYGGDRLAVTLPGAFVYAVSGGNLLAVFMAHGLYHPLLVAAAVAIGRVGFGWPVALVAGWIVAFCPLVYFYAGCLLPDNAMAFWIALASLGLVWVMRRTAESDVGLNRRLNLLVFASGLALGIACWAKESAAFFAVPMGLGIVFTSGRSNLRQILLGGSVFAAGVLLTFAVEAALMQLLFGRWWFRMFEATAKASHKMTMTVEQQGLMPWDRFATLVGATEHLFGVLWLPALAAVVVAVVLVRRARRPKVLAFLLALFAWFVVYHTFGSISLSAYVPPKIQIRYFAPAAVPGAVVTAFVLVWGLERAAIRWRRGFLFLSCLIAAVIVAGAVRAAQLGDRAGNIYNASLVRSFRSAYLDADLLHPDDQILLDETLAFRLKPLIPHERLVADGAMPTRPFLVFRLWRDREKPGPRIKTVLSRAGLGRARLEPIGRHVYRPWRSRWDEIQAALGYRGRARLAATGSRPAWYAVIVERLIPQPESAEQAANE